MASRLNQAMKVGEGESERGREERVRGKRGDASSPREEQKELMAEMTGFYRNYKLVKGKQSP